MGVAYCLQHMHGLNPPVAHIKLSSKDVFLTDDYAAKVGFFHVIRHMAAIPATNSVYDARRFSSCRLLMSLSGFNSYPPQ